MRLSPAHQKILRRMADGEEVWTMSGLNPSAFWHNAIASRSPRIDTITNLAIAGLIEAYEKEWRGSRYRISEAGRAAIANGQQTTGEK